MKKTIVDKIHRANPQGKGLSASVNLLATLNQNIAVQKKTVQQFADELFTSLFILHSEFKFKPVIGQQYWLYQKKDRFRLSIITPNEWKGEEFGKTIGCCQLHHDMTWTLEMSERAAMDQVFQDKLRWGKQLFESNMQKANTLDEMLPGYQNHLPYYQRAYATALGYSLGRSLHKSGLGQLSYQAALKKDAEV